MAATPNEDAAAAIAAAVERFAADVAPAADEQRQAVSPWQRAALVEGVGAKGGVAEREGGGRWPS